MKTKSNVLWTPLTLGSVAHHIYEIFNIHYKETIPIKRATKETLLSQPIFHVIFEGLCIISNLFTLEFTTTWFICLFHVRMFITALYNFYHPTETLLYES